MSNYDTSLLKPKDHHGVWTIPAHQAFLDTLAQGLLAIYKDSPLALSDVMLFLPTRRAGRGIVEAFLRHHHTPLLLPRIRTLGDLDENDVVSLDALAEEEVHLPPAISPLYRRLWLGKAIRQFFQARSAAASVPTWSHALAAADELATLIDAFHAEECDTAMLENLVPESLAQHWDDTLTFVKIVTSIWPQALQEKQALDPADRRSKLLTMLCDKWSVAPPAHPVIIAGSTGSLPAVARLMSVVAQMPKGSVILPGLDTAMEETTWHSIDDPHPQMGLKHLLTTYFPTLNRKTISIWGNDDSTKHLTSPREQLLSLALRPAAATDDWHRLVAALDSSGKTGEAISGLSIVESEDEDSEAEAIALLMREVIAKPPKKAILVTPDRLLARRVSEKLRRWNITVDDSAGTPLADSMRGTFLRMVASWLAEPSNPVLFLQLLRHPLCQCGMAPTEISGLIDLIDIDLRGYPPGAGFTGLKERLRHGLFWKEFQTEENDDTPPEQDHWQKLRPFIDWLENIYQPWAALSDQNTEIAATQLLAAHISVAQSLAATDEKSGEQILWQYADGEALANLLQDVWANEMALPVLPPAQYADFFTALLTGHQIHAARTTHPRLAILGPLEARLHQADTIILGSLNEGIWPHLGTQDPFLSRPMRIEIGLPSPERRIGLAAHDFAQLACAPEVVLTRSLRADRAPTNPSRWLLRLKNILQGLNVHTQTDHSASLRAWTEHLYQTTQTPTPAAKPGPTPPVDKRPRTLSVTQIETLLRDPYAIYARKILRLNKLDPLNKGSDNAMRGALLHAVFAETVRHHFDASAADFFDALNSALRRRFDEAGFSPALRALWNSRVQESFKWFVEFHTTRRKDWPHALLEVNGATTLSTLPAGEFTLKARADRIDSNAQNETSIIDYKSSIYTVPQAKTFNPQLQLTAMIIEDGGFSTLGKAKVHSYSLQKFWNRKNDASDQLLFSGDTAQENILSAREKIHQLLSAFDTVEMPYASQPRAKFKNKYGDFDHLARRSEWVMEQDEEGGND